MCMKWRKIEVVELLPPQFQSRPSFDNAIVKKPPHETAATGMGSALTLEGILRPPASFGPRPGPRPSRPSPSSRPQIYSSPAWIYIRNAIKEHRPKKHATNRFRRSDTYLFDLDESTKLL